MRITPERLLPFLLLLLPVQAAGQDAPYSEAGLPYFSEHFSPEEYHAFFQNWAVVQDNRGFIYVGNSNGVLEYDGVSWRLISNPANATGRSLAVDETGIVYVGIVGDFGYLQPDPAGTLRYVSLLDHVSLEARGQFSDVWSVHASDEGIYFQTREWLFRWDGREMKQWKAGNLFHTSFLVNGRLYVREVGRGLLEMVDGELRLTQGGEHFADVAIYAMMPHRSGSVLIGTRVEGFLLYDGNAYGPFPTEADSLLLENRLYTGITLSGGGYALATLGGGIILLNEQGAIVRIYKEGSGLVDNHVNGLYQDNQGGLWLALNSMGIMRINTSQQLTLFDRQLGVQGAVWNVIRHQGVLYAGASEGLFYLSGDSFKPDNLHGPHSFTKVPGINETITTLSSAGEDLLVGTRINLYVVRNGQMVSRITANTLDLTTSQKYPDRIYVGTKEGLRILDIADLRNSPPDSIGEVIPGTEGEFGSIVEEPDGTVWLAALNGDVLKARFSEDGEVLSVYRFSIQHGLPGELMAVHYFQGEVQFSSLSGIYKFVASSGSGRFEKNGRLTPASVAAEDTLVAAGVDQSGNMWLGYKERMDIARRQPDGSYVIETPSVLRFRRPSMQSLYAEPDGVVWFGDGGVLLRFDSKAHGSFEEPFIAAVRRVTLAGSDSVIFGGTFRTQAGQVSAVEDEALIPLLDYESNSFIIEFAAPSYNGIEKNEYQYYLEGRDTEWSSWTPRTSVTYTNLREGTFRFHVRARNGQGQISSTATFSVKRLPPWYRTAWAYGLYLVLAAGLTALAMHYRQVIQENRQAREQAQQLARERHANERLQHANVRLQEANERLQQADRLKDEFLTNTSHELRTPITAILGFTSVLKEELTSEYHEFLDIIDENSKRLLHTVSSLLDLAKLKAGIIELFSEPIDLGAQMTEIARLLSPLARRKEIYVDVVKPDDPIYIIVDVQCFERILYNILGNAIKFTEVGGVTVHIEQAGNEAKVRVIDTGVGMDEAFLPYVFDEFKQESSGLSRSHEGSGLGLAITARLVKLMNGRIEVESKKDEGSTFTLYFPLHVPEETSDVFPAKGQESVLEADPID
jgi:signal transduction histidine kinase